MTRDLQVLRGALVAGGIYFFAVAVAHLTAWKVPGLFIYFDVPSLPYQDQIIGVLALGWSVFFTAASRDPDHNRLLVDAALLAGALAILGLVSIQLRMVGGATAWVYWVEIGALAGYWMLLAVFIWRSRRPATAR